MGLGMALWLVLVYIYRLNRHCYGDFSVTPGPKCLVTVVRYAYKLALFDVAVDENF